MPHEPAVEQVLACLGQAAGKALEGQTLKEMVTSPEALGETHEPPKGEPEG